LDVIISTSIFKCIFFVAFKVGNQRNVEIDYHKCIKGKALINKEGRMTNGGKFESAIKKGDCSFESQFRFGWRKLIKWQDHQVETFIIIHKELEKKISKSTRKQSI